MLICFFDQEGIVHRGFVSPGMTVNTDFYCDVLRRLRENVGRKRPQKWQNKKLTIHHDNAPAHRSFKVSQFLAKNSMTVAPPSPILTRSGSLWLFPLPQAEALDEGAKIRHHWRDSRGIAVGTWHNSKKGLPEMLPSMAETLGLLYSCKRGVLWRWWRNLTSKVSKLFFTSTVLELLDTSLYNSVVHDGTPLNTSIIQAFNFVLR